MLITPVKIEDLAKWIDFSHEISDEIVKKLIPNPSVFWEGCEEYMIAKINKSQAFMAKDRISSGLLGVVAFSTSHNRITFFGVLEGADHDKVGIKLLEVAINQLDKTNEITATILKSCHPSVIQEKKLYESYGFVEQEGEILEAGVPACIMKRPPSKDKKGGSFHYNYHRYVKWTNETDCPVCQNEPGPTNILLIKELEHSWLEASMKAQGSIWGKCHLLSKKHYMELYEMSKEDLLSFMTDVQKASRALKKVTGATKINYEIHGNSMPHLHVHLFPRYLDDFFPSAPIDYRITEPIPYVDEGEFLYFIEEMRQELD